MGRLAAPVVSAVLGPTNTGKTHLAVERMLGHASGMIGFPLRLLAREIYDRVVAARGRGRVALITGEERIVPPAPAYFVCTVEAMPLERGVEFLAVDEVQLAADGERGHVFTDRLLRARGSAETMFLGSQSAEPLIRRLFPEITVITRPRFSHLRYAGPSKLRRLPRRSAVVAFSLADVYALAELVRHQRGGTAVVLGALSPRTRNAQVAMFEAGEVDYLVATDAIGMGLNLDLGHVAFAALHKFDGHAVRGLTPEESAQIAGRAGRHMSDGTFGTTAELEALPADVVQRVEQHRFEALRTFQYRNSELDYRSIAALQRSLEAPPRYRGLVRCREADDQRVLKALVHDPEIAARATGRGAVALLWDVCRIPDYRKTLAEAHARLLGRIFRYLIAPAGRLPTDWVADQMARLDCADGDIDTLAVRTAHVRTWTYISHRPGWLDDPEHWQARARAIEDRLSDALHERLLQRFVDRRLSSLARRLRERSELVAGVAPDGEVLVEGIGAGRLEGFRFRPNLGLASGEGRTLRAAARGALRHEVVRRAAVLAQAPDDAFSWGAEGRLRWNGDDVARLRAGTRVLAPRIALLAGEMPAGAHTEAVRRRLERWVGSRIEQQLAPLLRLRQASLGGAARGIAFQLCESLGALPRARVADQVVAIEGAERAALRLLGVHIGEVVVYLPAVLKPASLALRARLWTTLHRAEGGPLPAPGIVSFAATEDLPSGLLNALGYQPCGGRAVRCDMVEKLVRELRARARARTALPDHALLSLLGCGREMLPAVLAELGYRAVGPATETRILRAPRRITPAAPPVRRESPFAALAERLTSAKLARQ